MNKTPKLKLHMPTDSDLVTPEDFNVNSGVLEDYVTTLTQMCSATTPAALTLATTPKPIYFTAIVKTAPAFELSGGGVKVLVDGFATIDVHLHFKSFAVGDPLEMNITKNGATMWQFSSYDTVDGGWLTVDQTSQMIPIAKNDILGVQVRNTYSNKGILTQDASYMSVRLYKDCN